ncbi:FecR family protein [Alistipes sp. ZOR0009]|uniref:FecR family protein n=1 Tax=Alistipes sp. ZOR0009 TaxID=1339253 RepID=UPI000646E9EA|nr:FecR domain-containing protein [Alistipes sp. ZOR0009]
MKLDEKNIQHVELIAKYLSNEMDENERANFEIDAALDPANAALITEMKREWNMLNNFEHKKKVDANKAWDKLSSRLETEKLIPNKEPSKSRFSTRLLLSYAAILIAIVATASGILWGINGKDNTQMVSVLNANNENTVVQTLADGSIIYLNSNTTFAYPQQFANNERKVTLKGEAFFDIARNPEKPFIIETADAYVQVLGTAFNIKSYAQNGFELVVERGKVRVTLKNNPSISEVVVAGERMDISQNQLQKSHWTNDGSLAWRVGKMQFKDETLQNIVTVINRNYNTSITIPEHEVASRRMTVTFDKNSVNDIVELVCLSMNLKADRQGAQTILSSNEAK